MKNLEELPEEILAKIFNYSSISAENLISLSTVSKRFYNVCSSDESLWKSKFKQKWPFAWKKIVSGNVENKQLETWKKIVCDSVGISRKFEEILNSLSFQLYKFPGITKPILTSIFKLVDAGNFGSLIVLNELHWILKVESETDLTKLYYAKCVLYHVNYYLLSHEFDEFFKLPPERQSLEKGFYYLGKGIYPEDFLEMDYEVVSSKLEKLAIDVQSYLKTKYPNHPAASMELLLPDELLENTRWSYEECTELFECIRHIMFEENNYSEYEDESDIFLNKSFRRIMGLQRYMAIVFTAVSYRLGILLNLINCNETHLLKWKSANSENFEAIHPLILTNWNTLNEDLRDFFSQYERTTRRHLMYLALGSFHNEKEENVTDFGAGEEKIGSAGMILLLHTLEEDFKEFVTGEIVEFCLLYEIHIETVTEICEKLLQMNIMNKKGVKVIRYLFGYAQKRLELQRKGPKLIRPKYRTKKVKIKYATGMIVTHKINAASGVIIGWEEKFHGNKKESGISSLKYKEHQPFYKVLLTDGSLIYEAQENLLLSPEPVSIKHYEVGKYFRNFNGKFYVSNEENRTEYPHDEKVIQELIENCS